MDAENVQSIQTEPEYDGYEKPKVVELGSVAELTWEQSFLVTTGE